MKAASLVAATIACVALSAVPAAAQTGSVADQPDTRGLSIGVHLNRTAVNFQYQSSGDVLGAGGGVTVGYGLTNRLSAFARGNMGYQSTQVDLGARYRFGSPTGVLRPYVEAAVTRVGASRGGSGFEARESAWGTGATIGAGVEYFVSRNLAIDAGVVHTRGRFSEGTILDGGSGVSEKFISNRLQLGVTWRP
jgi:opacity protein-like surface antigen